MVVRLDVDSVVIRGGPLALVSGAAVDELQDRLGVALPDGYREFVTRLGEGTLNGFVRVLPPWRILAGLDEHRGTMAAYWFWGSGHTAFGQEQAMDSIQIADTIDGDVIAFHPRDRRQIVILPRNSNRLYDGGPDLLETINRLCSGGAPFRRFGPARYFEPFDSRLENPQKPAPKASPAALRASPRLAADQTPREVLLAYFAELRAVEEWAVASAGGPDAFFDDPTPHLDWKQLIASSDEIHSGYCTPTLAKALSGASVTVGGTPEHDPAAIRVLAEKEQAPGRVVIETSEGTVLLHRRKYLLERFGNEWRISSMTDLGLEVT